MAMKWRSIIILEYPDFVNVIAITKDKQFVLVRKYRHAVGKESFELLAGAMDTNNETPEEAARRELLEETGYGNGKWSFFHANLSKSSINDKL